MIEKPVGAPDAVTCYLDRTPAPPPTAACRWPSVTVVLAARPTGPPDFLDSGAPVRLKPFRRLSHNTWPM